MCVFLSLVHWIEIKILPSARFVRVLLLFYLKHIVNFLLLNEIIIIL